MLETNKEERRGNLSIVSDVCHVLRLLLQLNTGWSSKFLHHAIALLRKFIVPKVQKIQTLFFCQIGLGNEVIHELPTDPPPIQSSVVVEGLKGVSN